MTRWSSTKVGPCAAFGRFGVGEKTSRRRLSTQGLALTLGGSPQALLDDIRRFADAGMECLVLGFWDGDLQQHFDGMERFAEEVMGRIGGRR